VCDRDNLPFLLEAPRFSQLHPLNFDINFSSHIAGYQGAIDPHGGGCFLLNVALFGINNSQCRQTVELATPKYN
jgi:hypothetical protein